jgi:hypothetical protein
VRLPSRNDDDDDDGVRDIAITCIEQYVNSRGHLSAMKEQCLLLLLPLASQWFDCIELHALYQRISFSRPSSASFLLTR